MPDRIDDDRRSLRFAEEFSAVHAAFSELEFRESVSVNALRWLARALQALLQLRDLPANWDSYGSPPVQDRAVEGAFRLLLHAAAEQAAAPTIGPVAGGGVQLEWHINDRELELEVLPDGRMEFLTVQGEQMEEAPIAEGDPATVRHLIRWVHQR